MVAADVTGAAETDNSEFKVGFSGGLAKINSEIVKKSVDSIFFIDINK